ncbi:hypothetical protein E8E13_011187 [Curvularia kusanoi]|uniref:Uncharacterized protein n=1 Tax=Curvularia kusanoi TaxID=90978 RepID=A0A9P4TLJ8_CURKU|nr:hypothetical protein E8E13_011187 [Curvularia kusanoi]
MASFGKVLDLLDDRYLELQDVTGNVEPLLTLVQYEDYTQNALVYRMDTNHEIFMGLIQDFTMRRAHEMRKELWTWLVQWEVEHEPPTQQHSVSKRVRKDAQNPNVLFQKPLTPRQAPALTIFERRTLDGALMLEEHMLRILIDIVQVDSSLVPNFIEFLYRWVDYYEGDGKALKAALRWEIPSLWDFEYHPLVIPRDKEAEGDGHGGDSTDDSSENKAGSASCDNTAELRQSSPTKKMQARPKPDLAAFELRTLHAEESERLQYREVKFGIQPPKLEQPIPPLINIPRDHRKRTKYYAACFKSRQRALNLLLEAGVTMRQINNYQKLQTAHPKETSETGDGNGLRNYDKDAKYAQAHFELRERQNKQNEVSISNKLAVEAQFATTHAMPDGASGLPLIPPTPARTRRPDMAASMMQRIKAMRARNEGRISLVPELLVGKLKSKTFENARSPESHMTRLLQKISPPSLTWNQSSNLIDTQAQNDEDYDGNTDSDGEGSSSSESDAGVGSRDTIASTASAPLLPRPLLPRPLPLQLSTFNSASSSQGSTVGTSSQVNPCMPTLPTPGQPTPSQITTYIQNMNVEQTQSVIALLSQQERQAAASRLMQSIWQRSVASPAADVSQPQRSDTRGFNADYVSSRHQETSQQGIMWNTHTGSIQPPFSSAPSAVHQQSSAQRQGATSSNFPAISSRSNIASISQGTLHGTNLQSTQQEQSVTLQHLPIAGLNPLPAIQSATGPMANSSAFADTPGTTQPLPRAGLARTAPTPLSLSPPKSSPFTTFAPQVMATSPFAEAFSQPIPPIQIYLPKILASGNGESKMGTDGCNETDALLLGHEDAKSGALILTKAILLPVGVWENTIRKVRTGRWNVVETYACPSHHPAMGKGKGKEKATGCHRAVYDKLVQAYGMMNATPAAREELLTKRWRVTRGPVTSCDRGAVWEGWGVFVDRVVEMSAAERADALRNRAAVASKIDSDLGSGYDMGDEADEAKWRYKEMDELMDEYDEMDDEAL